MASTYRLIAYIFISSELVTVDHTSISYQVSGDVEYNAA